MRDVTWNLVRSSVRNRMLALIPLLFGLAFCANRATGVLAADGKWPMVGRAELIFHVLNRGNALDRIFDDGDDLFFRRFFRFLG